MLHTRHRAGCVRSDRCSSGPLRSSPCPAFAPLRSAPSQHSPLGARSAVVQTGNRHEAKHVGVSVTNRNGRLPSRTPAARPVDFAFHSHPLALALACRAGRVQGGCWSTSRGRATRPGLQAGPPRPRPPTHTPFWGSKVGCAPAARSRGGVPPPPPQPAPGTGASDPCAHPPGFPQQLIARTAAGTAAGDAAKRAGARHATASDDPVGRRSVARTSPATVATAAVCPAPPTRHARSTAALRPACREATPATRDGSCAAAGAAEPQPAANASTVNVDSHVRHAPRKREAGPCVLAQHVLGGGPAHALSRSHHPASQLCLPDTRCCPCACAPAYPAAPAPQEGVKS